MIVKERKVPMKILKLEALLRRLPSEHPKRLQIEEELAISKAGFRGEQAIDYYFSFVPKENHLIFNDLRLPMGDRFFQIDSLLLTPSYILIIELKNIAGTIWFDETFRQMIRVQDGKEERFPNPILQTARQKLQLQEWLAKNKYQKIPIHTVTVFTNNKSIIKTSSSNPHIMQQVIQAEQFPIFLEKMNEPKILTNKDLQNLSALFITNHVPTDIDVLQNFQIEKSELMTGIQCPQCSAIPMIRHLRKWQCPICLQFSHDAHLTSVEDYALLFHPTITNQQLRHFLNISCNQLAYYLLRSMNLSNSGQTKGTVWHIKI
ncbi:nuclease-related domain-containing protein [Bacillus sp. FJAT-52991]|uniref:Nuclease-related domain-containing protein n=1 Tax=Bacillus kandeliae TaxID=3129297 RepID=A0ABZ2N7A7_9BACI